jgi:uncharacterized membrane protein
LKFPNAVVADFAQPACAGIRKYASTLSIPWSLEHDSERPALGLASMERETFARRSCLDNKLEQEAPRLIPSLLGSETHARSVLKAISWRTLGTIDTFAISWFMTGRLEIAGSIAVLEVGTKIAWYYLHERVWSAIGWGRRDHSRDGHQH